MFSHENYKHYLNQHTTLPSTMLQQVKEPQENMYKDRIQECPEEGILQLKHTKEEVQVKNIQSAPIQGREATYHSRGNLVRRGGTTMERF